MQKQFENEIKYKSNNMFWDIFYRKFVKLLK